MRDAAIFYEDNGNLFDIGGLAYLPSGLFPELVTIFECPRFRRLGNGWYAWTASW